MTSDLSSAPVSPFYSRAYGGYTKAQIAFAEAVVGDPCGRTVLDPMGGQAHALGQWAQRGALVTIADLSPGPLALAGLRDPSLVLHAAELSDRLTKMVGQSRMRSRRGRQGEFTESWLAPRLHEALVDWGRTLGVSEPKDLKTALEQGEPLLRFAIGISVLAARALASFRRTDNLTWLKPGGLIRVESLKDAILSELRSWLEWSSGVRDVPRAQRGRLTLRWVFGGRHSLSRHDLVVTSPPYANRLDYTRLWAPELVILEAMSGVDIKAIKAGQLGTNLVRGQEFSERLPTSVESALRRIKKDPSPFSETYYYEFFRRYAHELVQQCDHIANSLAPGGLTVIFVRDTVRKDVRFPTAELVDWALRRQHRLTAVDTKSIVVRSHVGYRRRNQVKGLFGLAQEEHWLAFKRETE